MSDRPICNYEDSRYSTEFWNTARAYEDAVERMALRTMLPPKGETLIEIGAGYGRLADLYAGYKTVVLMDYAQTQLEQAVARLGAGDPQSGPRYIYVQANFYHLPFVAGLFDTVAMIRTLHHAVDAATVLEAIADVLAPAGTFVLEFANKQNVKAIARYLLGRQAWSPFSLAPVEFVELNFDFHPRWIWQQLAAHGLQRETMRTVSHFRMALLKRLIPTRVLAALDGLIQPTGSLWQLSPSVFVRSRANSDRQAAPTGSFFRCPACGAALGAPPQAVFHCSCGETWRRHGEIYDFRYPRE
jgi:ubiquinone/menaquinone biosynthesis C-methylase UbiE